MFNEGHFMATKPSKPSADFPLFAHHNGQWAKKINGKLHYFGPWSDPQAAAAKYKAMYLASPAATDATKKSSSKPSKIPARRKPKKPYPEYPLFAHDCGSWAKKIRGRMYYFGPWSDPQAALDRYLAEKDDLHAGRTPRTCVEGTTVRDVLNSFLNHKRRLLEAGEIVPRTFQDYHAICARISASIDRHRLVNDLRSEDFDRLRAELAKTRGPTALSNDITRIRIVFKYAYDAGLIDTPVRYGQSLKKPSRKTLRLARLKNGPRMFEAAAIRQMLHAAAPQLKAMILLGINCGFSNQDCGTLAISALDLDGGWVDFPRPKTANPRRCPLWQETVDAIRTARASAPSTMTENARGLVFVTSKGQPWAKEVDDNPISKESRKLLIALGLHRKGLSFGALRHTFETVGGETGDQVAVDFLMGHVADVNDMAARYRQRISDERLRAVTDHVHHWLFGDAGTGVDQADE